MSPIAQIAEDQWGLITRRQASSAGVAAATLDRLTAADGSVLERVAHGVYRIIGAPLPDHGGLRAAWLQLDPATVAWRRGPEQGVVSHRSAAELYGLGHLAADEHEFTFPARRQSRRADVRLHHRKLGDGDWTTARGILVTLPARIADDLLAEHEDPEAVGHVITDAIRTGLEYPGTFADALARHAARFGLRRGDGVALLRWLLDLTGDTDAARWISQAEARPELGHRLTGPEARRQVIP